MVRQQPPTGSQKLETASEEEEAATEETFFLLANANKHKYQRAPGGHSSLRLVSSLWNSFPLLLLLLLALL